MKKAYSALFALVAAVLLPGCAAVVLGGAAAGAGVAIDRRAPDTMATDQRIEWTAAQRIGQKFGDSGHVNVTSFNKQVLLTGEAPTQALKQDAESITAAVPDVRNVVNELTVGLPSGMESRSNDAYITSQVKARMVGQQKFNPLHVKVVTEAKVVYLMGLVSQKEATDATNIARGTKGVQKVVRVFEYIPAPPAR
jgi:osmotically-inducible protein OsmY